MLVDIYESSTPNFAPVQIGISGGTGKDVWQLSLALDVDTLTSGQPIEVEVIQGPLAVGRGSIVQFSSGDEPTRYIDAESGTIRVSLERSQPRASGSAEVVPSALSAAFEGTFRTRCFKAGADPATFEIDGSFSSPFCQQFAA